MTVSTLALTPGADAPGVGASTDTNARVSRDDAVDAILRGFGDSIEIIEHTDHPLDGHYGQLLDPEGRPFHPVHVTHNTAYRRGRREDYQRWLEHVDPAAACSHPVKLRGASHLIDSATGEVLSTRATADMPDEALYTTCGNRRASVCPACAEVYRADTYQLVLAGINGGKGVPATVSKHVAAFVTFTAPGFGDVHSRWAKPDQQAKVCRPRRKPDLCPHGKDRRCFQRHHVGERCLGTPHCLDCYDHDHQVVWNVMAAELWRRTIDKIKNRLDQWAKQHDTRLRLSYAKVAEMQERGVAHFHALIRLDGIDPTDDDAIVPPCEHADHTVLSDAITAAVEDTSFRTREHADQPSGPPNEDDPDQPEGWLIEWGSQLDIRPLRLTADGEVTETQVAGYLAKYATKSTEAVGYTSQRITPDTLDLHTKRDTHATRLVKACWRLGRPGVDPEPDLGKRPADETIFQRRQAEKQERAKDRIAYRRLRRWAHMLGFGGHFSTKSRRYSTTLRELREARVTWRRQHHQSAEHQDAEPETTLIVSSYTYADTGWHTLGDALLANTAAAQARERAHTARDEREQQYIDQ